LEEITRKKEVVKVKLLVKGLGQVTFTVVAGAIAGSSATKMDTLIAGPTFATVVQESYFDMAGMTQKEKTLFFETISIQEAYNPAIEGGHTGDGLIEQIVCTTSPIPADQRLTEFVLGASLPGSVMDWSQLVYYRHRTFTQTVDMAGFSYLPTNTESKMGSAFPTASDRIYIYRFLSASVVSAGAQFTSLTSPGCQIVLGASVKEEPEFQYLYRLMRSYELQQSHDED
jgi:hypothetical protein